MLLFSLTFSSNILFLLLLLLLLLPSLSSSCSCSSSSSCSSSFFFIQNNYTNYFFFFLLRYRNDTDFCLLVCFLFLITWYNVHKFIFWKVGGSAYICEIASNWMKWARTSLNALSAFVDNFLDVSSLPVDHIFPIIPDIIPYQRVTDRIVCNVCQYIEIILLPNQTLIFCIFDVPVKNKSVHIQYVNMKHILITCQKLRFLNM